MALVEVSSVGRIGMLRQIITEARSWIRRTQGEEGKAEGCRRATVQGMT